MKKYRVSRWVHLCLATLLFSCSTQKDDKPYVLLISFDGFRYDYVQKYQLPNFQKLIENGSAAEYMLPSFPSKTFPNHYTLVTGLYPGNHGLVDNTFYDTAREVRYTMSQRELVGDAYYYGGTPLWQLAQQQGLKAASFFWVGSEAPVAGSYPNFYKVYDHDFPNEARIDSVMKWLQLPAEERPHFVSLYFSIVDSEGHQSGPNSEKLRETVLKADSLLGQVMKQTEALGLAVNIMVTSDHGMYEMNGQPEIFIYVGALLESDTTVQFANSGALTHVYEADPDKREDLYQLFKSMEQHFVVYKKEETPETWHYRDHPRIGDLVLVAEPGHYFRNGFSDSRHAPMEGPWGVHGYDPYTTPDMRTIFYAMGPQIREGHSIKPFENVHVYPLVAEILGLKVPEDIDGDIQVLQEVLKK